MKRNERQILINPHSSVEKVPVGALNLGEIAVQHNNVEDAALYVETVGDSESAETIAKFITEKAIDNRIDDAMSVLQMDIDAINEAVGLPHDPEAWDSGMTVWDAIEQTYEEMTAGTAAATTKVVDSQDAESKKYLDVTGVIDPATSAATYTVKVSGIDARVDSAYTILNDTLNTLSAGTVSSIESAYTLLDEKINDLSAATEDVISELDWSGLTANGQAIVSISEEDGVITAAHGDIRAEHVTIADSGALLDATNVEDAIQELAAKANAITVTSEDGTVVVTSGTDGTDIAVNIDEKTIVKDRSGVLKADLEVAKLSNDEIAALSDANVKEAYKLIYATDSGRTAIGDVVKIYKDSALERVYIGHVDDALSSSTDPGSIVPGSGDTALCFIYERSDGTYELVGIDVEDFLQESEFADGLQVDNHVVSVKVDAESEEVEVDSAHTAPVLSVSEDGVKISNIQAAINYAVETLAHNVDADVTGTSSDGHVTVEVVQVDTQLDSVVVTTNDIASAAELDEVEGAVGLGANGKYVAKTGTNYLDSATTVEGEIDAIDKALKAVSDKLNAVSVAEGTSTGETYVKLDVSNDGNGATAITLDDSTLANEIEEIYSRISDEQAARETADEELLGSSASTSAETSLWGIKKLIAEITTTVVKDVTVPTGETLLEVSKEDTPEGDIYTVSSTERLNAAVDAAGDSIQGLEFGEVAEKDATRYGSNAGVTVTGETNEKKLVLDFSELMLDCGEY